MKSRREFLKKAVGISVASSGSRVKKEGKAATNLFSRERMRLRHRERLLVWNNDGSDMLAPAYQRGNWPVPVPSVDQFLDNLMRFILGTPVSSIFYCAHVNEPDWEIPLTHIRALGPNPFKHVVDFAHRHGKECFYSIRMNDIHASYWPPNRAYWVPFRRKHPELLLGYTTAQEFQKRFLPWIQRFLRLEEEHQARGFVPTQEQLTDLRLQAEREHPLSEVIQREGTFSKDLWSWAAYNYARLEVQAHYLEIIEGACRRYDLDGVELDWCRMPIFFKKGEERKNIPLMNDFVSQVHRFLQSYGEKRGRPILLAMRLPDSIDRCLSVGLDPETWARRGWMDLIMGGTGLMPFSAPLSEWVSLGRRHHLPVYGCLDRLHPIFRSGKPRFFAGDPQPADHPADYYFVHSAAHRFWQAKVDGIYLYDWFSHGGPTDPQDYGKLPDVTNQRFLGGASKLYQIDPGYPVRPGMGALDPACVPGQLPRRFTTSAGANRARFQLDIGDRVSASARILLRCQWNQTGANNRTRWKLNDAVLPEGEALTTLEKHQRPFLSGMDTGENWIEYRVPSGLLQRGTNHLELTVQGRENSDALLELLQVRIAILYRSDDELDRPSGK